MTKKIIPFFAAVLLLTIAIARDFYGRKTFSEQSMANAIRENMEHELTSLENEAQKILDDTASLNWSSLGHVFFLIENGKITEWSRNDFPIEVSDLEGDYKLKLLQTPRTDLLLHRTQISETKLLVGVIPLWTEYEIVNRYLAPNWNEHVFPVLGIKILSSNDSLGTAVCTSANGCLFKILATSDSFESNKLSTAITLLATLFALIGIGFNVQSQHRKRKYFPAFLILFISLAAIRIAMVQFQFPGRWIYSKFFDPKYFASSSFNASVGDFFLNALIVAVACSYLFRIYPRLAVIKISTRKSRRARSLLFLSIFSKSFFFFLFSLFFFVAFFFHFA